MAAVEALKTHITSTSGNRRPRTADPIAKCTIMARVHRIRCSTGTTGRCTTTDTVPKRIATSERYASITYMITVQVTWVPTAWYHRWTTRYLSRDGASRDHFDYRLEREALIFLYIICNVHTQVYYNFVRLLFSILYAQKWKLSIFLVILCALLFLNPPLYVP